MATENFTDLELACRCGCGGLPPAEFQSELQRLRRGYGKSMRLSSACRCPNHNDAVSSTGRAGPHTHGAVDVLVFGSEAHDLLSVALAYGWNGIGVAQKGPRASRFLHLDMLSGDTRPWVWSY